MYAVGLNFLNFNSIYSSLHASINHFYSPKLRLSLTHRSPPASDTEFSQIPVNVDIFFCTISGSHYNYYFYLLL